MSESVFAKRQVISKVLIVSEGYGSQLFGVSQVLIRLARCCRLKRMQYRILVAHVDGLPDNDAGNVVMIPSIDSRWPLLWHPCQKTFLDYQIQKFDPDIIHIHGALTWIQRNAVLVSQKRGIPVVLSTHGMLEPWFFNKWGIVKRLCWNILLKPVLQGVTCLHAITRQESESLSREFPGVPQVVIPNAIDLSDWSNGQAEPDDERFFFYLGRLHPIKGLDLLIPAFFRMQRKNYKLVIAGPDFTAEYTEYLKQMVEKYNLEQSVSFIGAIYGERKESLLSKAWAVIVPSYSEVVALVNLESAAAYTPTITTTVTGLHDWKESGGLLVEPEVGHIADALEQVASWTLEERLQRGRQSRRFVEERYSWDVICERWMNTYQAISSGCPP